MARPKTTTHIDHEWTGMPQLRCMTAKLRSATWHAQVRHGEDKRGTGGHGAVKHSTGIASISTAQGCRYGAAERADEHKRDAAKACPAGIIAPSTAAVSSKTAMRKEAHGAAQENIKVPAADHTAAKAAKVGESVSTPALAWHSG